MEYAQLDPTDSEIRILSVESALRPSDPIRCKLEHVSLHNLPPYTALSYCWGDATHRRSIDIGSHTFRVTTNLYEALSSLRSKGIFRLWVDAICINQRDTDEKSSQIYLMRSIFQRAREVIAWVGPEDKEGSAGPLMDHLSSRIGDFREQDFPFFS